AQVRDGYSVQTNIVRTDGNRSALLTVLKHGSASTLSVVNGVKNLLPRIAATLPPDLKINQLFDQSLFVRASISGVVREATIAAGLTAVMILLFLGSWRSTLIVCLSIPLSILTSLIVLGSLGQTINVMTLGGLALAVVFAMLMSYFLTRTVVPTLVHYMLPAEMALYQEGEDRRAAAKAAGVIWRIHEAFDRQFEKLRHAYHGLLEWVLQNRMVA